MIYLDTTATTKPKQEYIDLYNRISNDYWINASSNYNLGLKANSLLESGINKVKEVLNVPKHKVYFTSSATLCNNIAIQGVVNSYQSNKFRIITTKIEHPSVYNVFKHYEELGYDVVYLNVLENGIIDIEELKQAINKDTILVSIMWVNNILGSIQPINNVVKIVKEYPRCKLHVDCVQGIGKIRPNFNFSDVDLLTFSMHKLEGLKGSGILLSKINLSNIIFGASQQDGIIPGTIDIPKNIVACKTLINAYQNTSNDFELIKDLRDYLVKHLSNINNIVINTNTVYSSPYIVNISVKNMNGETLMHALEQKEIYVSNGSACNSKTKKIERSVFEVTKNKEFAVNSLRISLSKYITYNDLDILINEINKKVNNG